MFELFTQKLSGLLGGLRKKGLLSEKDIDAFLKEIKIVFLESDIHFKVVRQIIERVREKAVQETVLKTISPGDQVAKIVYDELTGLLGAEADIRFRNGAPGKPRVLMLAGLQGSGKTTACVKLASYFTRRFKARVGLVAADLSRPAAVEQLQVLARRADVEVYAEPQSKDVVTVCRRGRDHLTQKGFELIIIDTAGRVHLDAELMDELRCVKQAVAVDEVALVLDAMTGQEALNIATEFHNALSLDWAVLSKVDGDARGGCAVSFRAVTGRPLWFLSTGEKIEDFEEFRAERVVGRIFGLGDLMGMVEKAQDAISVEQAKELQTKFKKSSFDMEDLVEQIRTIRRMGGLGSLVSMLPGGGNLSQLIETQSRDKDPMKRTEAIILSMTPRERRNPDLIDGSRRQRIARGSGTAVSDVNEVLRQYAMMKKMMKGSMAGKMMKNLTKMGGMKWQP